MTLWKGCENVINYNHSQCFEGVYLTAFSQSFHSVNGLLIKSSNTHTKVHSYLKECITWSLLESFFVNFQLRLAYKSTEKLWKIWKAKILQCTVLVMKSVSWEVGGSKIRMLLKKWCNPIVEILRKMRSEWVVLSNTGQWLKFHHQANMHHPPQIKVSEWDT